MKIQWMIVLAFLIVIAGCDSAKKAEDAAINAAQDAKVKALVEEAKKQPKPNIGPPGLLGGEEEKEDSKEEGDLDEEDADNAAEEKAEADKAAAEKEAAEKGEGEDDKGTEEDKTETSLKLNAQTVLDEAIASAKANDKALFVHFTAAW